MKAGHRIQADSADVKLRQVGQAFGRAGQLGQHRGIDRIEELGAVGDLRALGPPGGARGVHQHPDIVELGAVSRGGRTAGRHDLLVIAVTTVPFEDQMRQFAATFEFGDLLGKFFAVKEYRRFGIIDDELELRHGQSPVEWQVNGAGAGCGENDFVVIGGVVAKGCHAIARFDAGLPLQIAGQRIDSLMHLQIGKASARIQILLCRTVGRKAGVISDPVVVLDFHTRVSAAAMTDQDRP